MPSKVVLSMTGYGKRGAAIDWQWAMNARDETEQQFNRQCNCDCGVAVRLLNTCEYIKFSNVLGAD